MNGRKKRLLVDWGHLALLVFISGIVLGYLLDARATSLKLNNLLLVEPAAIIALILVAIVLPQCFRRVDDGATPEEAEHRETLGELGKVASLAAAFGAFVLSLETIGFDIATFLFVAFGLFVCGERRLWVVVAFSAVFTAVIVYGYQALVPFPFPLKLL